MQKLLQDVCVCVVDIYDFLHVFLNIRLNMDT